MIGAMRVADTSAFTGAGGWLPDGRGRYDSWRSFLLDIGTDDPAIARTGGGELLRPTSPRSRCSSLRSRRSSPWSVSCPERRNLVHNDLLHRKVFIDRGGSIAGVIDWANSMYGDSLYDVALLAFWSPWFQAIDEAVVVAQARSRLAAGDDNFEERLRAYQLHIGLDHIAYNAFLGPERGGEMERVCRRTADVVRRLSRRPTISLWKNLVVPDQDELALTERLISYDTSHPEGIRAAVGFVKGWLEARGIAHREYEVNGLPALVAAVGDGPATLVWNSHVDVVPARREQFSPWRVDGKLYGRGAYDMKGALGAMLAGLADLARASELIPNLKVKLLIVPDEEAEEDSAQGKASAFLADEGHLGQFVICGEPTNLEIGVQSKGVLVCRFDVSGRAAHGATPWLGDNAILKAIEIYKRVAELPFAEERSELFEGPSINIGRISGGEVVNSVPDSCRMDVDVPLPAQPGSPGGASPAALAGRRRGADLRAAAGHPRSWRGACRGAA